MRSASVVRETAETWVRVELLLDGVGEALVSTPCSFLNHLLGAFAKHGLFDLRVEAEARIDPDLHHTVEDVAIALGQAFDEALGDRVGISRFGYAIVPMDDSLILVSVDCGGRPYVSVKATFSKTQIGDLDTDMVEHFIRSLANSSRATIHVLELSGSNDHHKAEAIFKALGVAMKNAVELQPRASDRVPSQKGVI